MTRLKKKYGDPKGHMNRGNGQFLSCRYWQNCMRWISLRLRMFMTTNDNNLGKGDIKTARGGEGGQGIRH